MKPYKCDTCAKNKFHVGGSWRAVVEGGGDPYSYYYCSAHHWADHPLNDGEDTLLQDWDPWENCKDYRRGKENLHYQIKGERK